MGYTVEWFDNNDDVEQYDFSKTLFLTASNVDQNIPIRDDCYYIYHHCWCKEHQCAKEKYFQLINMNRCISIKCFWKPYLEEDADWTKVEPFFYKSFKQKECVFPWATDQLPREIDKEIKRLGKTKKKKQVCFVGTISGGGYGANLAELTPFFEEAKKHGYSILTSDPWSKPLSIRKNREIMRESLICPAIQGAWQSENGYIPCRIFKAIGCGNLAITNSWYVSELFEHMIVYNPDTKQLFYDAIKALESHTPEMQIKLMNLVKKKHTYIHRIQFLLNFLEELNEK